MEAKRCRQCGEIKPVANFRPYYSGKSTYTICKVCEKINSREKYLTRKGDKATKADRAELEKIHELYAYQRLCGLKPPRRATEADTVVDDMLSKFKTSYEAMPAQAGPEELQKWLTTELTGTPEYYIDTVYEQLLSKYKPLLRVDYETLTPVYDETYLDLLNKILERFNNYEDQYYN